MFLKKNNLLIDFEVIAVKQIKINKDCYHICLLKYVPDGVLLIMHVGSLWSGWNYILSKYCNWYVYYKDFETETLFNIVRNRSMTYMQYQVILKDLSNWELFVVLYDNHL